MRIFKEKHRRELPRHLPVWEFLVYQIHPMSNPKVEISSGPRSSVSVLRDGVYAALSTYGGHHQLPKLMKLKVGILLDLVSRIYDRSAHAVVQVSTDDWRDWQRLRKMPHACVKVEFTPSGPDDPLPIQYLWHGSFTGDFLLTQEAEKIQELDPFPSLSCDSEKVEWIRDVCGSPGIPEEAFALALVVDGIRRSSSSSVVKDYAKSYCDKIVDHLKARLGYLPVSVRVIGPRMVFEFTEYVPPGLTYIISGGRIRPNSTALNAGLYDVGRQYINSILRPNGPVSDSAVASMCSVGHLRESLEKSRHDLRQLLAWFQQNTSLRVEFVDGPVAPLMGMG